MSKKKSKHAGQYRAIAEYYDAEYETNDVLDNDVPLLLSHLPKKRQNVLELCCGTARCAIPIAQAGHRVVGFDIDADLIDIACRKRDAVGLSERELSLHTADALSFDFGEKFDWAFLVFNTLMNFTTAESQDALLRAVTAHLKPGGKFWVDVFNPDPGIYGLDYAPHFDSATFYVPALDRSVHRVTSLRRSTTTPQLQHTAFHYTWHDAHGELHEAVVKFDMTYMYPRELQRLLQAHGFTVDAIYGDYDRSPVTPESPRIIAVATMNKER